MKLSPFVTETNHPFDSINEKYKNVEIVYVLDKITTCIADLPFCHGFRTNDRETHTVFSHGQHWRFRLEWMYKFLLRAIPFIYDRCNFIQHFFVDCCRLRPVHFSLLLHGERVSKLTFAHFSLSFLLAQLGLRLRSFQNVLPVNKSTKTKTTTQKLDGISQWELNDSNQLKTMVVIFFSLLLLSVLFFA